MGTYKGNDITREPMMNTSTSTETVRRLSTRYAHTIALVLALVVGMASVGAYVPAFGQTEPTVDQASPYTILQPDASISAQAVVQSCAERAPGLGAEAFIRTELFFGTLKPNGKEVTEEQFNRFLDRVITPEFPDGLTVLTGLGQFRDGNEVKQETSYLLILLYPLETARESSAKIEKIRGLYEDQFDQQSVLRSDDAHPVCVSF